MNIQPNVAMDKAAFLAWAETAEEKYELAGGHIMMMPRPSRAHGRIVTNLIVALRNRIDPAQWDVISEFGLDTGPRTLRYPDVVVDAVGAGGDYIATTPVLVAEVLSPSTAAIDLGDKPIEYLQAPSLRRLYGAVPGRAQGMGMGARRCRLPCRACDHRRRGRGYHGCQAADRIAAGGNLCWYRRV